MEIENVRYEVFSRFRFAVVIPTVGTLGVTSIYSDVFSPTLWIKRAHSTGRKTLFEQLNAVKAADVWMLTHGMTGPARRVSVSWENVRWIPFDLDATEGSVALETVELQGVVYSIPEELDCVDFPRGLGDI